MVIRTVAMLVLAFGVEGCVAMTLFPLCDDFQYKDLARDDRLVGVWLQGDALWTVRRVSDFNRYVAIEDRGELRSAYAAHLVRLGRYLFLDLQATPPKDWQDKYDRHIVYGHTVSRVEFIRDTLKLSMLANWACPDSAEATTGKWLSFVAGFESSESCLITATTAELRAYLTQHASEDSLFRRVDLLRVR